MSYNKETQVLRKWVEKIWVVIGSMEHFHVKMLKKSSSMVRSENLWRHKFMINHQKLLESQRTQVDGIFLVRESLTLPNSYVLSVLFNNEFYHYQIQQHGEDAFFSIDSQCIQHGLDYLIEFYSKES